MAHGDAIRLLQADADQATALRSSLGLIAKFQVLIHK